MGFLRRQPPLHEQLAREGGLVEVDPRPAWQETGIHGIPRPRAADVTVTGEAAGIEANAVGWVTLPDGTLLVAHEEFKQEKFRRGEMDFSSPTEDAPLGDLQRQIAEYEFAARLPGAPARGYGRAKQQTRTVSSRNRRLLSQAL